MVPQICQKLYYWELLSKAGTALGELKVALSLASKLGSSGNDGAVCQKGAAEEIKYK